MQFTIDNRDNIVIFSLKNTTVESKLPQNLKLNCSYWLSLDIDALILDLTNVQAIDSSGLGALLLAHRQLKEHSIPVILVGVQEFVMSLMNMTRIDELFRIL